MATIKASPERRRLVGQLALATRRRDPERAAELRAALEAARLEDAVQEFLSTAPTPEQRERLAALITGGHRDDTA